MTVIRPARGWVSIGLGELWTYRELLGFLAWRDIKVRYKQTVLGALWAVLQPVAAMCVFTIFFHRVAGIAPDGDVPYPLWSYAGLLPWTLFAQSVTRAAASLVTDAQLVTKVYFPRMAMPLAATLSVSVDFVLAFVVYLGMMVYFGQGWGLEVVFLPLLVLLAIATAVGVGLWLAAINVKYRDVRHVVPFLVQMWLFVSPVVYPSSAVPEAYRFAYGLNPMVGVIEGFRWCVLGVGQGPGPLLWLSAVVAVVLLVSGAHYFRRMEASFADVV
jgi:lipopolysaccharide transport system permease protein